VCSFTSWVPACCLRPPAHSRCLTFSLSSHAEVSRSASFRLFPNPEGGFSAVAFPSANSYSVRVPQILCR
jgi:hypothetical protein